MTGTTGKPSAGCEHGRKGTMYNSGSAAAEPKKHSVDFP
jgi:hypothetical protein